MLPQIQFSLSEDGIVCKVRASAVFGSALLFGSPGFLLCIRIIKLLFDFSPVTILHISLTVRPVKST